MAPAPTNRQVLVTALSADTEQSIHDSCVAQGCTCGDRLKISVRALADHERPPDAEGFAKASQVDVTHSMECPLLARQMGRN